MLELYSCPITCIHVYRSPFRRSMTFKIFFEQIRNKQGYLACLTVSKLQYYFWVFHNIYMMFSRFLNRQITTGQYDTMNVRRYARIFKSFSIFSDFRWSYDNKIFFRKIHRISCVSKDFLSRLYFLIMDCLSDYWKMLAFGRCLFTSVNSFFFTIFYN